MKNNNKLLIILPLVLVMFFGCVSHKIDSQLQKAEEFKGTLKFDQAVGVYKLIISRYPKDAKTAIAHIKLGDLYRYKFNKAEEALSEYKKVMDRWPTLESARDAATKRANIFRTRGDHRKAILEYEWVVKHFPAYENANKLKIQIAKCYIDLQDPYQASVELEELLKTENLDKDIKAEAHFNLGESYLFLKEYEKSFKSFENISKEYPEAPFLLDAKVRMVECLEKMDRPEEAIRLQEELIRLYPDSEFIQKRAEGLKRREEKSKKPE